MIRLILRAVILLLPLAQLAVCSLNNAFDVREATIESVHDALFSRETTCREIVSAFIARIEEFNPTLHAILSLHPDALSVADHLDQRIAAGNTTGPLFCIPVLLKDNFDAVGTNTTGGCLALANNRPLVDAPTVTELKRAGAVILGKTNLHELALDGLTVSSLGGQTLNPYDLTRTPGGSSGGTGAAIAANFAILGTGTDTINSLRSPASANSLFSFRPTRGLISRTGVIPVSFTQDAVGAMARDLKDLAVALTVMAGVGYDPKDNVTASFSRKLLPGKLQHKDYTKALKGGSLQGRVFGMLDGFFNHAASSETTPVNEVMAEMVKRLEAAGAIVWNVTDPIFNPKTIAGYGLQEFEFRESLDAYLARPELSGEPRPKSFHEIYSREGYHSDFLVTPSLPQPDYPWRDMISSSSQGSTSDELYRRTVKLGPALDDYVESGFEKGSFDALIYPEQSNLVVHVGADRQVGRNGMLAALTGRPVITVPAGFSRPTRDAPIGVPIGMEILGRKLDEENLLNIAQLISELVPVRKMPPFAEKAVEPKLYESVPVIKPNRENIPETYALGIWV
ncbi:amidase signature domain-containing protein [Podospora australis]|uniref:Amidase signature domain-containing protein n=1 Tax=Podospora australis TaxID=1536484 RepID=A0AAN6WS48_9PEZI|nr:amidase signature domain-containing protein [Podospora australis]